MTAQTIGTREEWLAARRELLAAEKEHTRRADELARRRRELPWVPVEKPYAFDTEDGPKTLAGLFDGRSQLIVYHFMLGADWEEGCKSCSFWADNFNGIVEHLAHRDITMVATSLRAAHKRALADAKRGDKKGAPASCHATEDARDLAGAFDALTKRTGACVAKDSELDGQWSQLDSAVLAYGRCIDCQHPQSDRLIGCQRILELVTSAEK